MTPVVDELHKIANSGLYIKIPKFELKTERQCDFDENNVAVVRWDGEVSPCYRFLHTYYEYIFGRKKKVNAYSFGNVREKSLAEIWTSEKYTWFRFTMKNYMYPPSCTDCELRDACDFVKTSDIDCWGERTELRRLPLGEEINLLSHPAVHVRKVPSPLESSSRLLPWLWLFYM